MSVLWPIIILSIPWAISIHTVTAFLYNGLSSRPFWNASILAPRFIASALCSGPALMLILFQIVRKVSKMEISNTAIFKIAELIAYAMGINLFLFGAEFFKEFYSSTRGVFILLPWSISILDCTAIPIWLHGCGRHLYLI
jgi:molybdopterin-containing oxidoreductase family membrane subunit